MKTKLYVILFFITGIILVFSCSKKDNYDEPSETLFGVVIDSTRGDSVQTEIGSGGTRVKMMEYSWSSNPTPYYFSSKQDGTFENTKIFAGYYGITVEGAFVPLVQTNEEGDTIINRSQYIDIKGNVGLTFKVEPLLRIDWIGTPVINTDSTINVQVRITRGTNNPDFQQELTDVFLFVSNTQYAGNNNYDPNYSSHTTFNGTEGNAKIGQTMTLTTIGGKLQSKRDYYIRVGARINYGLKQYNYNAPLKISL